MPCHAVVASTDSIHRQIASPCEGLEEGCLTERSTDDHHCRQTTVRLPVQVEEPSQDLSAAGERIEEKDTRDSHFVALNSFKVNSSASPATTTTLLTLDNILDIDLCTPKELSWTLSPDGILHLELSANFSTSPFMLGKWGLAAYVEEVLIYTRKPFVLAYVESISHFLDLQ